VINDLFPFFFLKEATALVILSEAREARVAKDLLFNGFAPVQKQVLRAQRRSG
jgi:hypothetical protein